MSADKKVLTSVAMLVDWMVAWRVDWMVDWRDLSRVALLVYVVAAWMAATWDALLAEWSAFLRDASTAAQLEILREY